jgi:enoyl-CoA hydratase/carnithine racemase
MTVRIEKSRNVWNVIHSRTEKRNTMNPESADTLQEAFLEFEKGVGAVVAFF